MRKESFKKKAQKDQLQYFDKSLNQSGITNSERKGRAQEHWLNDIAAKNGNIFYCDYKILEKAIAHRKDKQNTPEWFYDTLRSQHIPFNFFIPLLEEKQLALDVLNNLLDLQIKSINEIKIEHPPQWKNPLGDRTSFDVFISYQNQSDEKGIIGIEVKYTEGGYSPTKTEKTMIADLSSIYYQVTEKSKLYKKEKVEKLKENSYRQIWRNHLLAYAFAVENNFKKYTSLTIYHEGNLHFEAAFNDYNDFLTDNGKKTLKHVTFSEFLLKLLVSTKTTRQKKWILYLAERYKIHLENRLLNQLRELV